MCNSGLRIFPKYIDWDTRHSDCHHVAYDKLPSKQGEHVYRLKPQSAQQRRKCEFQILIVRKPAGEDGWEALGYVKEQEWRHSTFANAQVLDCGPMF